MKETLRKVGVLYLARTSTVRAPVVEPRVERTAGGEPINLETFLFACASTLAMPGFGTGAIRDAEGRPQDLNNATDFFLRGLANIAHAGEPMPPASDDDLEITGFARYAELLQQTLAPDEWRRVATLLTRGGRFDTLENTWAGEQIKQRHQSALPLWDEELAQMRHSMNGQRFSGCPIWQPTLLANGTPMREVYTEADWPLLMISYKSNLMSSISITAPRLRQVHAHNPVSIHHDDAQKLGIANGQRVRIASPSGSIIGVAVLRKGIMQGTVAVEFGYGHKELGARAHSIDGHEVAADRGAAAGVNMNDIGIVDPTRGTDQANGWVDTLSGAVVRQGIPVRIEAA